MGPRDSVGDELGAPERHAEVLNPGHVNVTLFGKQAMADVVKMRSQF